MQQPGGAPEQAGVVVGTTGVPTQLSREAKHMRVMLMLCVKEKTFDQAVLESIFNQWLLCEQQNDGHVEETDAAFRRSLGRIYGPRSKEFLGAIDRAKVKLEQLKERKSRGDMPPTTGPPNGAPPPTGGQPPLGNPASMGSGVGQPHPMSHQTLGQMPHLSQSQPQHALQHGPPQHMQHQLPPQQQHLQHPSQQHPPQSHLSQQHPPRSNMPNMSNPQYYKPHPAPSHPQQHHNVNMGGQQLPHIQNGPPIIGIQSTQPSYNMPNQPMSSGPSQSLPQHHNQSVPTIGMTQQPLMYDNRPPSILNPGSNPDMIRPLPNMNPLASSNPQQQQHNNQLQSDIFKTNNPTPVPIDHGEDHKDDPKKKATKKKGAGDDAEETKRKKGGANAGDTKKQKGGKGAGEIAEKEAPRMVGGLPISDIRIPPPSSSAANNGNNLDDLDNITEKPNLQQEGLQVTSNRQMSGYIIDGGMLNAEESSSRHLMRQNINPLSSSYNNLNPDGTPTASVTSILPSSLAANNNAGIELEPWMDKNLVGKEILDRGMNSLFNMKLEMSSESRKLLSDGIQNHLKTILENSLELSRKRLNRTACGNFYESFQYLKHHGGSIAPEHHLQNVAIKWGPNVMNLLQEEENKLKSFYKDYSDIDEEKLKEKMKQFDEERMKLAGAKRRIGGAGGNIEMEPQTTWWDNDKFYEEEGLLSYEKIAEVWKKNDLALKHELGPNSKRKSQKKVDTAPVETASNEAKVGGLRLTDANDSSIPMDADDLKNNEREWRNQLCPIDIPTETFVTSEDLHFVISKFNSRSGGLIGSRADRDKIRKARFQRKPISR